MVGLRESDEKISGEKKKKKRIKGLCVASVEWGFVELGGASCTFRRSGQKTRARGAVDKEGGGAIPGEGKGPGNNKQTISQRPETRGVHPAPRANPLGGIDDSAISHCLVSYVAQKQGPEDPRGTINSGKCPESRSKDVMGGSRIKTNEKVREKKKENYAKTHRI